MAKSLSSKQISRKNKLPQGKGGFDLIEEAIHLVRTAPGLLAFYYIGSLPFLLALLYFWTDMSRSAFASRHCVEASLGLACVFLWMKSWQTVFTSKLLAQIRGVAFDGWSWRRGVRLVVVQTMLQPWGLWLLPGALLLTLPFPWLYAFYQNITVFGDGCDGHVRTVLQRSWRQAKLWPKQNLLLLWLLSPWIVAAAAMLALAAMFAGSTARIGAFGGVLMFLGLLALIPLSPFGVVISANIGATLLLLPQFLKLLFGIETIFTLSSAYVLNTTFLAVVCALTYLCLDPLVKAAYTLRCFYGEALQTGEDLRVELQRLATARKMSVTILLIVSCLGGGVSVPAAAAAASVAQARLPAAEQPESPRAQELDAALDKVMQKAEYAWRLPREKSSAEKIDTQEPPGFLAGIAEMLENWGIKMQEWFSKLEDWFEKLFRQQPAGRPGRAADAGWEPQIQGLLFALLAAVTCLLALLVWRAWQQRRQPDREVVAEKIAVTPDLADENLAAGDLPEDGWLALAQELLAQGQLRLALRALYLASLACLARYELLALAKGKSEREYERELKRRAHALPALLATFAENVRQFERAWYGMHEVTQSVIADFRDNAEKIRGMLSEEQQPGAS